MVVMNSYWNKYVLFYDTFGACIVHSEWLNTLAATIWNKSNKILTDRFKQFSLHCLTNNFFWNHVISCGSDGKGIVRHNHLWDAIFSSAASASLAPWKPEWALIPGKGNQPADDLIPHWSKGLDAALDVTVVCKGTTSRVDSEVVTWFF